MGAQIHTMTRVYYPLPQQTRLNKYIITRRGGYTVYWGSGTWEVGCETGKFTGSGGFYIQFTDHIVHLLRWRREREQGPRRGYYDQHREQWEERSADSRRNLVHGLFGKL